jgi:hypothetical protein
MPIDPKIEQPTRTMLGHAIRHELEELASLIRAAGNEALLESIPLCLVASAYIAIDVCERWPADTDLHENAKNAAESVSGLDITEQEIYQYLSRNALGSERLDEVFSEEGVATVPLFATANLLLTFCPARSTGESTWIRSGTPSRQPSARVSPSSPPSCSVPTTSARSLPESRPLPQPRPARRAQPTRRRWR